MGCLKNNIRFVQGNVGVVFFINVKIFNQPVLEEIVKCELSILELLLRKDMRNFAQKLL